MKIGLVIAAILGAEAALAHWDVARHDWCPTEYLPCWRFYPTARDPMSPAQGPRDPLREELPR